MTLYDEMNRKKNRNLWNFTLIILQDIYRILSEYCNKYFKISEIIISYTFFQMILQYHKGSDLESFSDPVI